MPRLVFKIVEHNNWSIFIQYHNNNFHVFGKRRFNDAAIFHSTFYSADDVGSYLEEIADFKSMKNDFSITLFYSNLMPDSFYSEFESYAADRTKEIIGYDNITFSKHTCMKYLQFVKSNVYITER